MASRDSESTSLHAPGRDGVFITRTAALLVAVFSGLLSMINIAVPVLMHAGMHDACHLIRWILGPVCHQDPDRSLFMLGEQLGLCARCSAIFFFSFLTGVAALIKPGTAPAGRALYLIALGCMAPMFIEVGTTLLTGVEFDMSVRMLTGALHGAGASGLIILLARDAWKMLPGRRRPAG